MDLPVPLLPRYRCDSSIARTAMRKAPLVATALLLALTAGGVVAYFVFKGSEHTLYIDRGQIQEGIDKRMQYEKRVVLIFVLRLKNTKVLLAKGSDRTGTSTDVELNVKINDKPKNLRGAQFLTHCGCTRRIAATSRCYRGTSGGIA